jgi:nicotinamide riboside kinase
MKRIAMAGAQDTGKTTIAKELSSRFKTRGYITDYIEESARLYISRWGEPIDSVSSQLFILDKQIEREAYISPKCELSFTDSPLFLSVAYSLLAKPKMISQKERDIYISAYEKILKYGNYDYVFFLTPFREPIDDGIRSKDLISKNSTIDKMIRSYLDLHLIDYTEVNHLTINERIDFIDLKLSEQFPKK